MFKTLGKTGSVLLASSSMATALTSDTCTVSNTDKKDCGFAGITSNECSNKGCCWSPAGQMISIFTDFLTLFVSFVTSCF
jgi:hypothetical protein